MKKKIIIASATVLFAVATVFNMNLLQGNSMGDVSLDAIAVMAQAQGETIGDGCDDCQYYVKDVTCIRFFYTSDGQKYAVYIGNRLKCKNGGTGSCVSTDC
jgi:hypothetical protein